MGVSLVCTGCGEQVDDEKALRCPGCDGPLELPEVVGSRPGPWVPGETLIERYKDFFPFANGRADLSLGEGFTPLVKLDGIGKRLGLSVLWGKNEGANPTWSFKDRGTLAGVIHALESGYSRIGTVSTGNMAASVAAYGAKAGLETVILVGRGLPREKLGPIAMYGARLIKVDGDYGRLYYESLRLAKDRNIAFINSDAPFRVAGSRTIAYEICEQLNFTVPDWVLIPVSAGGNFRGIARGFREFFLSGLIDKVPRLMAVQADGCSPVVRAFEEGSPKVDRFDSPHTVAHAIENPFPPSGNEVLRLVRENGWSCRAVSEDSILEACLGGLPGCLEGCRQRRPGRVGSVRSTSVDRERPQIHGGVRTARSDLGGKHTGKPRERFGPTVTRSARTEITPPSSPIVLLYLPFTYGRT